MRCKSTTACDFALPHLILNDGLEPQLLFQSPLINTDNMREIIASLMLSLAIFVITFLISSSTIGRFLRASPPTPIAFGYHFTASHITIHTPGIHNDDV